MKKVLRILILLFSLLSFSVPMCLAETEYLPNVDNIDIWQGSNYNNTKNEYLDKLKWEWDVKTGTKWEKSIIELLYTIAKDLKTVMYIVAGLYFMIITVRLIFSWNTETWVKNFKNGVIWITLWIFLMQIAYYFVNTLYARDVWWILASNFTSDIIKPIIKLLETATSFFFILMAIYAFYKMITSDGKEENAKEWKMTIAYALIWFVIVKLAKEIVYSVYWQIDCQESWPGWIFQFSWSKCIASNDLTWIVSIVVRIINWMNGFIWIFVLMMIIYAWVQIFFSNWDAEKVNKAKKTIVYITIWIGVLAFNFLILTFFILPEVTI